MKLIKLTYLQTTDFEKKKSSILEIGFYLMFFLWIFDSQNILGGKNFVFICFLCLFGIFMKYRYEYLRILLFCYFYFFVSLCFNLLFPNEELDLENLLSQGRLFILLLLLSFTSKTSKPRLFKIFYKVVFFYAIFVNCFDWFVIINWDFSSEWHHRFPKITQIIDSDNSLTNLFFGSIGEKRFLYIYDLPREVYGFDLPMIYSNTHFLFLIGLAFASYKFWVELKTKYLFHSFLFIVPLMFSGTRALVGCSLLIVFFCVFYSTIIHRKILIAKFFIIAMVLSVGWFVYSQFQIKSNSNMIKGDILNRVIEKILDNPLRYLLIGDGPGAKCHFVRGYLAHTEIIILDFIRYYGLLFTAVFFAFVLYPAFKLFFGIKEKYAKIMGFAFFNVVLVANTNPMLFKAEGFIAITLMYYLLHHNINMELK